jgi:uroporphyrinogen decarboxylase
VPFVGSILKRLRTELRDAVPLIGFAGAPWTLASYMIEGGGSKSFSEIKGMAYREPAVLHTLLDKLAKTISAYLLFQIESGAQVIQLFDTWAGDLNRADYEEFALPYTQKIFEAIGTRVPKILYLNGCSTLLNSMVRSGADVLSIDWRISIADARAQVGNRVALQGNLDPCLLLGAKDRLLNKTAEILKLAGARGHIMNLGHGILPPTPVDNARAFVDFVKGFRLTQ